MGTLPLMNGTIMQAEKTRARFQLEMEAIQKCKDLQLSVDQVAIEKAVARANGLNLGNFTVLKELDLEQRLWKLRSQVPLVKAMRSALDDYKKNFAAKDPSQSDGTETEHLKEIVAAVEQVGLDRKSDKWITEVEGQALFE